MTIGVNERGLYLALLGPFSWSHPPMLISWKLVRKSVSSTHPQWGATLELGELPAIEVNISPRILSLLEQKAPNVFSERV